MTCIRKSASKITHFMGSQGNKDIQVSCAPTTPGKAMALSNLAAQSETPVYGGLVLLIAAEVKVVGHERKACTGLVFFLQLSSY